MPADLTSVDGYYRRQEDLPADPPPGDYVVVDVLYFTSTVVELLAEGADHVYVTEERGDEFGYRERHPDAVLGGGRKSGTGEPADGYDLHNSPHLAWDLDVAERPVAMRSVNGAKAIDRAVEADLNAFVASTTNAAAVANHLAERDRATYIVAAGSGGEPVVEDDIGAVALDRNLSGEPLSGVEQGVLAEQLAVARGHEYADERPWRRPDLELVQRFDSRAVVPRLEERQVVDVSE